MTDFTIHVLEERLAHLAAAVEDLSDIVVRQGGEIDRLTRRVAMLMEREAERELDAGGPLPLADQTPPHW
ncbi:SlyX protein [Rhodovulum imhoffii]|uniref:SlyX protein n=1 Tax=Rhodovulum imhoffii TaxID=365340 RepID=A0A2T5BS84_9RHOB|nr:SlyX family protein [Rhodovulum imhoffii]MBK5934763.1 SlyX protein [Rhodovulum imhoffii]PTN02187.1 SlyX protein [Rhodovulum imhoffii]